MTRCLALLALCTGALALVPPASAGGPGRERLADHDTLAKGTLEGLSLDEDGVLRPGPVFAATPLDAATAWAAVQVGDDLWIGTGNEAALLRVAADGAKQRVALGKGLMVTALAALPDGSLAAAVYPGARIYKVTADGQPTLHATLPVEHVWALACDKVGTLTAACGVPGSLQRIDPFGAVEEVAKVDDDHARCLARREDVLYVGTAPKGRVLAFEGKRQRVVRDLEPQEVVGIVPLEDGGLLIAANADQAGGNAQTLANLLRQIAEPQATKPNSKPRKRESLQDGSIHHLEPTGVLTTLWSAKKVAVLGLARDGRGAAAGTYPAGRVVRVAPGAPAAVLADLPEAEASVVLGGERLAAVVTSNPAVLHRRKPSLFKGTWTSAPLDAGATASWGRVTLWGRGVKTLQVRMGETEEPDEAWSDWKPVAGFDGEAGALGVQARFVQVRATLEGEDASLRALEIVRRTPNGAPVIESLEVKAPDAKAKEQAPPKATPVRQIEWKVKDPDGDRLRTTLEVNRRGSPHWTRLVDEEVLAKPTHAWDTTGMPDGIYQVAVTVDDGPDNEPGRVRQARRVYTGLRVDNTAPVVTVRARRYGGNRLRVEGAAEDANDGRIASVRVSIDGGDWIPLGAADGLYDGAKEGFASVLPVPERGAYDVVVQARDAQGNLGAAATVVR